MITARHELASGVVVWWSVPTASCPRGPGFKCLPEAWNSEAKARIVQLEVRNSNVCLKPETQRQRPGLCNSSCAIQMFAWSLKLRGKGQDCATGVAQFITHAPHNDLGVQSSTSHRGKPDSMPSQNLLDLWWTKWHWDRFFSQEFMFCLVSIITPLLNTYRPIPDAGTLSRLTTHIGLVPHR